MKLGEILEKYLSTQALTILKTVGRLAVELDKPVYLVGGAVRDILLSRTSHDLDFVTEGSGIKLGQIVCAQLGGELTTHERFGTAVWTPPSDIFDYTIDFITARQESYAHPAALPDVIPSNMRDDLFRRDFTINALAIRLDGDHCGDLLDFYGGQKDLEQKRVSILHKNSFADDPTRVLRAVRYAQRLNFDFSAETLAALQADGSKISLLSADRIRHEFEKILSEDAPEPILQQLNKLAFFEQIATAICWRASDQAAFTKLDASLKSEPGISALAESGLMHLRFLSWICASPQPASTAATFTQAFNFSADMSHDLEAILQFTEHPNRLAADAQPGTIEKAFRRLSATQLTMLQITDFLPPPIRELIPTYFVKWRHIKTFTNGHTLKKLGLRPGPQFKIILDALLDAKLNGEIATADAEIELIKRLTQS